MAGHYTLFMTATHNTTITMGYASTQTGPHTKIGSTKTEAQQCPWSSNFKHVMITNIVWCEETLKWLILWHFIVCNLKLDNITLPFNKIHFYTLYINWPLIFIPIKHLLASAAIHTNSMFTKSVSGLKWKYILWTSLSYVSTGARIVQLIWRLAMSSMTEELEF
jgi:hypothetical protein